MREGHQGGPMVATSRGRDGPGVDLVRQTNVLLLRSDAVAVGSDRKGFDRLPRRLVLPISGDDFSGLRRRRHPDRGSDSEDGSGSPETWTGRPSGLKGPRGPTQSQETRRRNMVVGTYVPGHSGGRQDTPGTSRHSGDFETLGGRRDTPGGFGTLRGASGHLVDDGTLRGFRDT